MSLADLLKGSSHGGDDGPPPGDDAGDGPGASDYDAAGKSAMKDFIAAVHSRDAGAAWDALQRAYSLCDKDDDGGMGGGDEPHKGSGGGHALLLAVPHDG